MQDVDHISAVAMQGRKYNLLIFSLMGSFMLLIMLAIKSSIPEAIPFIGVVMMFILLSIFEKRIKNVFSNKVEIEITSELIAIRFCDMHGADLDRKDVIAFSDLASFKTVRGRYGMVVLKMYLSDGRKMAYTFLDQWPKSSANVIEPFFTHVSSFNRSQNQVQVNIHCSPVAAKAGLWSFGVIAVSLSVCLATHKIHDTGAVLLSTVPGLGLYLGLIMVRADEKAGQKQLTGNKK